MTVAAVVPEPSTSGTQLRCQRCAGKFDSRPALRDHLIRDHKLDRIRAVIEAQDQSEAALSPPPPSGGAAGLTETDHEEDNQVAKPTRRKRTAKTAVAATAPCSGCKRVDGTHAPSCYKSRTGATPARRKVGRPRGGHSAAPAPTGAAAALRAEIAQLDTKRSKLVDALAILEG